VALLEGLDDKDCATSAPGWLASLAGGALSGKMTPVKTNAWLPGERRSGHFCQVVWVHRI
jgi:hypothetical protein